MEEATTAGIPSPSTLPSADCGATAAATLQPGLGARSCALASAAGHPRHRFQGAPPAFDSAGRHGGSCHRCRRRHAQIHTT